MASKKTSVHGVRTPDEIWAKAKQRAASEGVVLNHVINEILEGYGRGLINPPKIVKQYSRPTPPVKAP